VFSYLSGKDGTTVKKLIASSLVCGIMLLGGLGCGDDKPKVPTGGGAPPPASPPKGAAATPPKAVTKMPASEMN
jgi:hypothetical protein